MNISSLTSIFKKKPEQLVSLDTILIKKLKNLSKQSNLLVFNNTTIYHHTNAYPIGLLVLDNLRGLYIFESKAWTYHELKNANIQKAQKQEHSSETLAYENTQEIIKQKFNELTHNDGVPIFNYLLMENLNADEYEHLDNSFKTLLPKERIIFSDSNQADILKKLQMVSEPRNDLVSVDEIMGTLLIQYAILDEKGLPHFCSDEQRAFIDKPLEPITHLTGVHGSGKSNVLLLKALVELLDKKSKKIIILKPTVLSCDIFKNKLLNLIEHAIIEIDLTSIEIITPLELLNRHLNKLGKERISHIEIPPKLMKKRYHFADVIMCDDSDQLGHEFTLYLNHLQTKSNLVLVSSLNSEQVNLSKNFKSIAQNVHFHHTNPHAKALQLISKLVEENAKNILIVSNAMSREKLKDDLLSFVDTQLETVDSSQALINQHFDNLLFCSYADIYELHTEHIILMDLCFTSKNQIEYAFNLALTSVNVLYGAECEEIKELRNKYEQSSQE